MAQITIDDSYEHGFAKEPRWGYGKPPHLGLLALMQKTNDSSGLVAEIARKQEGFLKDVPAKGGFVNWQDNFGTELDKVALVAHVAASLPSTVYEVGCGTSSHWLAWAREKLAPNMRIKCLDPEPRVFLPSGVEHDRRALQGVHPADVASELKAGDILFVDGSHRAWQNSDVVALVLDIMPLLEPGVIVHFHDIFFPEDYPHHWVGRLYSEQYLLAAALLGSEEYEPLFGSHYVGTVPSLKAQWDWLFALPALTGAKPAEWSMGGSFWFVKKERFFTEGTTIGS